MNVLVVNDLSWDNFALVSKRVNSKCIDPNYRINYFYGKHLKYMQNVCNQNMMHLLRTTLIDGKEQMCLYELLKYTRFCIIFHNFTEYNTISSLMIDLCDKNRIPYFVFSEHCDKFYFSGEYITDTKFKTCVRNVQFEERDPVIEIPENVVFRHTQSSMPKNIQETINNMRSKYQVIQEKKDSRRIVYDENLVKERKKIVKSNKELKYIEYMENKQRWYRDTVPKS